MITDSALRDLLEEIRTGTAAEYATWRRPEQPVATTTKNESDDGPSPDEVLRMLRQQEQRPNDNDDDEEEEEEEECAICHEPRTSADNPFGRWSGAACPHSACRSCRKSWLEKGNDTCPFCRANISEHLAQAPAAVQGVTV
mmetsp:Transcript_29507/g.96097  ORF Transcript_29507/g.96097 Transcript_29507/m.96097 type:complete len:141 (+) Transcript_29507:46-468(+)